MPPISLYRITEGAGIAAVTPGRRASLSSVARRPLNGAVDDGIFVWRDCPTGEWRLKTAAGGGSVVYAGTITSTANYVRVSRVGLNSADQLNFTTNPKQIVFRFDTRGAATDGANFSRARAPAPA